MDTGVAALLSRRQTRSSLLAPTAPLVALAARGQAFGNLLSPKASNSSKAFKLRSARSGFALLPVVDRLTRDTEQRAVVGCGQAQLGAVRRNARRTEPAARTVFIGHCLRRRCLARIGSGQPLHRFLQRGDFTPERRDCTAMQHALPLQRFDLRAHLFASDTSDFFFQGGCDIWHGCIVPSRSAGTTFPCVNSQRTYEKR